MNSGASFSQLDGTTHHGVDNGEDGVLLRPFFTKILAWTTFVHFSNPGAKNPSLDEFLGIYALFCRILGDL